VWGYTTCRQSEGVCVGIHYVQTVRGGTCGGTLRADSQRGYVRDYRVLLSISRDTEGVAVHEVMRCQIVGRCYLVHLGRAGLSPPGFELRLTLAVWRPEW